MARFCTHLNTSLPGNTALVADVGLLEERYRKHMTMKNMKIRDEYLRLYRINVCLNNPNFCTPNTIKGKGYKRLVARSR